MELGARTPGRRFAAMPLRLPRAFVCDAFSVRARQSYAMLKKRTGTSRSIFFLGVGLERLGAGPLFSPCYHT